MRVRESVLLEHNINLCECRLDFARDSVNYLEHVITTQGIQTGKNKVHS